MRRVVAAKRVAGIALAFALSVVLLCACSAGQDETQEAQEANQAYMSQVNELMDSLDSGLDGFVDAVSRGDVVAMRTQAEGAFAAIDALSELEAPEALSDIQESYIAGATELDGALTAYIDLYTEIDSATEANPFDWGTYDQRIDAIKAQYDNGVSLLKAGDGAAASKE